MGWRPKGANPYKRSVGAGQDVRDSVSERRALKKQLIEPVLCYNLHVKIAAIIYFQKIDFPRIFGFREAGDILFRLGRKSRNHGEIQFKFRIALIRNMTNFLRARPSGRFG